MKFILLILLVVAAGCGNHPLSRNEEQRSDSVRKLFAELLDPPAELANSKSVVKEVLLRNLDGLYFLINHPDLLKKTKVPAEIIHAIPADALERLKDQPLETIAKALRQLDQSFFDDIQKTLDNSVKNFKFAAKDLEAIKIPKLGEAWTDFFQGVLVNYFPALPLKDRKRILAFMILKLNDLSTDNEVLLNWVYASGPYFQKYLQLMADYLEPGDDHNLAELKQGLMKVKDALPSIPKVLIDVYLQELAKEGYQIEIIRSLGAASVGEAFLAKLGGKNGRQVVIKFRRPGIEDIAKAEEIFFSSQAAKAQGDALKASFKEVSLQINEEFDYRTEYKKIKAGIKAYENDPSYPIKVVRPLSEDEFPSSDRYLAMEFVDGKTFRQLDKNPLQQHAKSILWERMTRKFMKQALFAKENHFFHGDLHEGNMMVVFSPDLKLAEDATREEVQKAVDNGLISLVLIDFGNAHELTSGQSLALRNIFLSAAKLSNSAQVFLDNICPEAPAKVLESLQESVFSNVAEKREVEVPQKLGAAMDVLLMNNLPIPGFLMAFERSLGMLSNVKHNSEANLHQISQDAYVNEVKDLVAGMNGAVKNSVLDGIVLDAQVVDFERNDLGLGEDWRLARLAWAAESDRQKKLNQTFGLLKILVNKLPKTSSEGVGTRAWRFVRDGFSNMLPPTVPPLKSSEEPAPAPNPEPAPATAKQSDTEYWIDQVVSGVFLEWEVQKITDIGGDGVKWKEQRNDLAKAFAKKDWQAVAYSGLQLLKVVPPAIEGRLMDFVRDNPELAQTDYWYLKYVRSLFKRSSSGHDSLWVSGLEYLLKPGTTGEDAYWETYNFGL
ncbi:MAG: AarF/UbiB family protein [Myxococcota bacterium]